MGMQEYVNQTLFGEPGGNCNAACLATILGLPLDRIPHFCRDVPQDDDWVREMNAWLAQFGLAILTLDLRDDGGLPPMNALAAGAMCVISGKSPRGDFNHCVVGRYELDDEGHRLEYVHDPHPDRTWLEKARSVDFFICIDPQRLIRKGKL